eukprot:3806344-Amphidinium_carterae.1
MSNGFDKHLERIHDFPQSCYASITFTFDGDDHSSASSAETVSDMLEYTSDVLILIGRCELATSACRELDFLRDDPIWDQMGQCEELAGGSLYKTGSISKYSGPKSHWLPAPPGLLQMAIWSELKRWARDELKPRVLQDPCLTTHRNMN